MHSTFPPTEIILSPSCDRLGCHYLEDNPQPGTYVEVDGKTYLILERRHRYRLKAGRYQLHQVALYVQKNALPAERSLCNGLWVIGDLTCVYNARSEMLRCAVNPTGSCDRCGHYQPLKNELG
jgi:Family of unknown function (DUF6464)